MISRKVIKISGVCGIILTVVMLITLLLSIHQNPWFNWTENAISDLGTPEASPLLFNFGVILTGVLLLVFTLGLMLYFDDGKPGPFFLMISSFFLIMIGVFSLPHNYHMYVSGMFFVSFPLGFLITGILSYKSEDKFRKNMGVFALVVAIIAAISFALLFLLTGEAIPEMLVVLPGFLWCILYGYHMLKY
jgi:hypothetical membrane protein